jgi:hypothetical protein
MAMDTKEDKAPVSFAIVVGHGVNDGNERTFLIAADMSCSPNGYDSLLRLLSSRTGSSRSRMARSVWRHSPVAVPPH